VQDSILNHENLKEEKFSLPTWLSEINLNQPRAKEDQNLELNGNENVRGTQYGRNALSCQQYYFLIYSRGH
jgi:hypothetical protein